MTTGLPADPVDFGLLIRVQMEIEKQDRIHLKIPRIQVKNADTIVFSTATNCVMTRCNAEHPLTLEQ